MSIVPNLLISLSLATLLSFAAPMVVLGGILSILFAFTYLPGLAMVGQGCAIQILTFLAVFGSGGPFQGILTIGFVCGIVGGLFNLFNFCRYQLLRN